MAGGAGVHRYDRRGRYIGTLYKREGGGKRRIGLIRLIGLIGLIGQDGKLQI